MQRRKGWPTMARLRGGDKLEAALREISRKVGKPGTLRVGFLSDATYPDGTPVALVAAANEFGTKRIAHRTGPIVAQVECRFAEIFLRGRLRDLREFRIAREPSVIVELNDDAHGPRLTRFA